jgi:hypothetical protein
MTGPVQRKKQPRGAGSSRQPSIHPRTTRLTVSVPKILLDRLRNTVFWVPQYTLARLVETAIQGALDRMESDNGGPFPPRSRELKPGRPKTGRADGQTTVSGPLESDSRPAARRIMDVPAHNSAQAGSFCSISQGALSQGLPESPG